MRRERLASLMGIAVLAAVTTQAANIDRWTGGSNGNWTNTANWSIGDLPTTTNNGYARFSSANDGAVIDSAVTGTTYRLEFGRKAAAGTLAINSGGSITINQFRIGAYQSSDSGTVEIDGGALTINGGNHGIGYVGSGIVNLKSGTFDSTDDLIVGRGGTANGTLNVSGGALTTVDQITVGGRSISNTNTGGTGLFTLSGGSADIGTALKIGNGGNGTLTVSGSGDLTVGDLDIYTPSDDVGATYAVVANLNGGSVHADRVIIGQDGTLNLASAATLDTYTNMIFRADGLLVWEGDHTNDVATLVGNGTFTWGNATADYSDSRAYDQEYLSGGEYLRTKYDAGNGETQVWTVIPEPATLGMVGMVATGILFIRRRFMI